MKQGLIWRIGDGTQVDIWQDPWLPRGVTRRPTTQQGQAIISKVSELMNPVTEGWDVDLVHELFTEEDAQIILSIPVRPDMEDFPAWHYDKRGRFSVKSAYHLGVSIKEAEGQRDAGPSCGQHIWKLDLPGKVRMFLWRLAHNSLPTRMNIKRKHIQLDTLCPMCSRLDEDGRHLFLKCKLVKVVWREQNLEDVRLQLLACQDPHGMFEQIFTLPREKILRVAVLLWDWWTSRNKVNSGEEGKTPQEMSGFISRHLMDFGVSTVQRSPVPSSPVQKWCPPPSAMVKLNFDAAYNGETGAAAWGFVARDESGQFLAAATGKLEYVRSPLQAEANACLKAIEGVSELGAQRIILESDCITLVNALNGREHDASELGVLFREAKSLCMASFQSHEFMHCNRVCNKVAHYLAQFGMGSVDPFSVWVYDAPDFVLSLLAADLAGLV